MALDAIADLSRRRWRRRTVELVTLADRARDARAWKEAAQLYREALDRDPDNAPIWVQYGHALKESGGLHDREKLAQAERAYQMAQSIDPRAADPHLQLGHVLKLLGKSEEAKASYLRAFALDASMPYPLDELRGLGWSDAELSELRAIVLCEDQDLGIASARAWQPAVSTGRVADQAPAAERAREGLLSAYSIGPVELRNIVSQVGSAWSASPVDAPPAAGDPIPPIRTPPHEHAVSVDHAQSRTASLQRPDSLNAVILAQRWDLNGVKEQLRDAIEEKRRLESILITRIIALEAELRDVSGVSDTLRRAAKSYETLLGRLRQMPLDVICPLVGELRKDPTLFPDLMLVWESGLFDETYYRDQCAEGEIPKDVPAIFHYLRLGDANRHDPHPLFWGEHYRQQLERGRKPNNLLTDYLRNGSDLSPNPLFNPIYYSEQHPHTKEIGISPLSHYVLVGAVAGSDPHPLFDTRYYCSQLEAQGLSRPENPLAHYLASRSPRISPHPLFDADFYLESHPEVEKAGCAPLAHFVREGLQRDWNPHPLFDIAFYREQAAKRGITSANPLAYFSKFGGVLGLSPHPLFDSAYYLERSLDVSESGTNPLRHYLEFGDREGLRDPRRDPHPLFSVRYYKAKSGIGADDNALLHYLGEGRRAADPHPLFDTRFYLTAVGRELPRETSPLLYYLTSSEPQVSPFPLFDQNYYRAQLAETIHDDGPLLLHYLKQPPEAARSPHALFDLQFFQETEGYSQPSLLAFVSKFWDMATNGYKLASMRFREANRDFCSISYLLDHPDLLNGTEIPLVHYSRSADTGLLWKNGQPAGSIASYSDAELSAFFEPAVYVPSLVLEIAREQVRRGIRYLTDDDGIFLGTRRADSALIGLFEICNPYARGDEREVIGAVAKSRRLAVYAIYVPDGRLKSYHKATLTALRNADYVTILVNSTTAGAAALAGDATDLARAVVVRSGAGRDFASWIIALAHFAPALEHADHTLLLNDSLIGPFGNLRSTLTSLEEDPADFKGLTDSFEREYHLQSSLLMLSRDALFSSAFLKFMLNFVPPTTRHGVVREGEIGLSMELIRAGVTSSSTIPYSALVETWLRGMTSRLQWAHRLPERLEETGLGRLIRPEVAARFSTFLDDWLFDHAARLRSGVPCNPQHWLWDGLITDGNLPFVKKDLLLINPEHIPTIIRLCDIFPQNQRPEFAELLRDLVPPERGLPLSYLHLSERLVDAIYA
jgi:tetratricopeptide (TPR) repeat protein